MKFLLLGTLRSIYIRQYIENVLEPMGFEICMQVPKEDKEYAKIFLKEHNVNCIKNHEINIKILQRAPRIRYVLQVFYNLIELLKNRPYDYIHLQFVGLIDLFCISLIKSKKTKCFASYWGSDLLRQTQKYLKREEKYLRDYELISGDSYILKNTYENVYPKLNVKFEIIPFGVSLIQYIDKYSKDINSCKAYFGFPKNKKIIAIGYNAIKQQQHDKVMDALKSVENKDNYFLVFQMSYGFNADKDYVPILIKKIEKSGFSYKVITDFLSMDDLAKLRLSTDIFINAQTTDAFSNSFIENVYTKSIMINAKWLHYPELDKFPLYVNEFSDFNEIPYLLEKRIDDEKLEWNKKCIENRTWDNCRKKWAEIYGIENK